MSALQDQSLVDDGKFEEPLKRVVFKPGMLLGVEATRSEQDYHRRRLTRHQYWLHGHGTVAGLIVQLQPSPPDPKPDDYLNQHLATRLIVTPGVAIDGLGREIMSHEPYCIDLKEWLEAHSDEQRRWVVGNGGYQSGDNTLWLKVTCRYQEQPSGLQPVMATAVNAGTDPVQPSRLKDCLLLELIPDVPLFDDAAYAPWGPPAHLDPLQAGRGHGNLPTNPGARLNASEQAYLALHGDSGGVLNLHAAQLLGLGNDNDALDMKMREDEAARTLLARIRIRLAADRRVISNPDRIDINNLIRPFIVTPRQVLQLNQGSNP